jgi:hypothetical protein
VRNRRVVDDLPAGVAADRASIWRSKRHGAVVGLDFAVRGASEDICREILQQEVGDAVPSSCAMAIRLDLTRINDHDVAIHGGRGANGRLIRT